MGVIRYGRTAQIGVYPGNQSGNLISYRSGFAKPPLGDDTTLWYDFAGDKSLAGKIGPTLDFTRASIGSYVGADKLIKYAVSNEPRFDHDPVTGESLGLLIEEARTNICLRSEDFSTIWTNTNAAPTYNQAIAPDGAVTADRLIDNALGGTASVFFSQSITLANATAYTASCFIKADQLFWGRLLLDTGAGFNAGGYFDLANGVVGTTTGTALTGSGIEDYGNGWYRCWIEFTSDGIAGAIRLYVAEQDNNNLVDLDGTSSIFVWGADLEAGSFPTSYIPTRPPLTVVTTRAFDFVSTTDTSWYTEGVGTFYLNSGRFGTANGYPAALTAATGYHRLLAASNGSLTAQTVGSGPVYSTISNGVYPGPSKAAFAFDATDQQIAANGALGGNDANGTTPVNPSTLFLGDLDGVGNSAMNGHIAEFAYSNVRKDNQFLQDVTS